MWEAYQDSSHHLAEEKDLTDGQSSSTLLEHKLWGRTPFSFLPRFFHKGPEFSSRHSILQILELISQFDLFLAEHIKTCGQKGRESVLYLSSTTCEEVMGVKKLAGNCRRASWCKIFLCHRRFDQLTFIFNSEPYRTKFGRLWDCHNRQSWAGFV